MKKNSKIFVAGHRGMVGSAIVRKLKKEGYNNLILKNRQELNLLDTDKVKNFFENNKPEYVFLAAAKVGGIKANMETPIEFLRENLLIQDNIIHNSYIYKVKKLIFLGSSCIYPRECEQPMKEEYLMTGKLEPTNEAYSLAKIIGIKQSQYYSKSGLNVINLMPCNIYGTNDHFDLKKSHVLTALIKRFSDAVDNNIKTVTLWGTGIARREFMHVDDLADTIFFLTKHYNSSEIINVGTGIDISIKQLANLIADKLNFKGKINWDSSMPDGMPLKCLDVSKLENIGFKAKINLEKGIEQTIFEYKNIQQ